MIYIAKKRQMLTACKFTGEITEELTELGITPVNNTMVSPAQVCNNCGEPISKHAMINNNIICPNQYIIYSCGNITNIMSAESFEELYKPIIDEE